MKSVFSNLGESKLPLTSRINQTLSLAANAGSSVLAKFAIPVNMGALVKARLFACAGGLEVLSVVADAGADTLTLVAHGVVTGTPVFVVGGTQPGGVTATTVYYARAASADTITLYGTQAQSVTGGGTGLVDITTAGATVKVYKTTLNAVYEVAGAFQNRNGTLAIIGSVDKVGYENVAGWDCDIAANNTTDVVEIKGTPDGVLDTRFFVEAEITQFALNV